MVRRLGAVCVARALLVAVSLYLLVCWVNTACYVIVSNAYLFRISVLCVVVVASSHSGGLRAGQVGVVLDCLPASVCKL